ncbi:hypothetical protein MD484_g7216, partial [Candolleomyces efflorescens]
MSSQPTSLSTNPPGMPLFRPINNSKFLAGVCTRFISHLIEGSQGNGIWEGKLQQFIAEVFDRFPTLTEAAVFAALLLMQQLKQVHGLSLGVKEGGEYGEPFASGHALFITGLIIAQRDVVKEPVSYEFWSTTVLQGMMQEPVLMAMEKEVRESLEGKMALDYQTIIKFRKDVACIHGVPMHLALTRGQI